MNKLNKIITQLKEEFKDEKNFKYQTIFKENRDYIIQTDRFKEEITSDDNVISEVYFRWLLDLSILHFEYSSYSIEELKDKEKAKYHLSLSTQYGYLCLEYGSQSCGCFKNKNPFIIQNKAVFMMSNLLLTNNINKFKSIGDHLIDSLNGKSCIIKKGYKDSTISWFILELYSLYSNHEITLHKLLKPKLEFPYIEIINNFETNNINEVEKYVELLCEYHIEIARECYMIHEVEQYDEEDDERDIFGMKYKELFSVNIYHLPFEALVYLKLREEKGFKNPKEFNHPLMNTNITKIYLSIIEPLEKPKELQYAYELIEKLKNNCDKFKTKNTTIGVVT